MRPCAWLGEGAKWPALVSTAFCAPRGDALIGGRFADRLGQAAADADRFFGLAYPTGGLPAGTFARLGAHLPEAPPV